MVPYLNKVTREQLLSPTEMNQDTNIPLMFITTYSRANANFKELFPNIGPILVQLGNWEIRTS